MSMKKNKFTKAFHSAMSAMSAAIFGAPKGGLTSHVIPGTDIPQSKIKRGDGPMGAIMPPSPLQKGYFCPPAARAGTKRRKDREARDALIRKAYYAKTPEMHRWTRQQQRAYARALERGRDPMALLN